MQGGSWAPSTRLALCSEKITRASLCRSTTQISHAPVFYIANVPLSQIGKIWQIPYPEVVIPRQPPSIKGDTDVDDFSRELSAFGTALDPAGAAARLASRHGHGVSDSDDNGAHYIEKEETTWHCLLPGTNKARYRGD